MELVGSGFGCGVDHPPGTAPILRGEVTGLNIELLERVWGRKHRSDRQIGIGHIHAVQKVVVRGWAVAVHNHALMLALSVRYAVVVVGVTRDRKSTRLN